MLHSLRFRIIVAFSLFGAILGIIYSIVVVIGLINVEDSTFFHRMRLEAELFRQQYREDPTAARLPHTRFMYSYLSLKDMSEFWQQHLDGLGVGNHKLDFMQDGQELSYYIFIAALPETDSGKLYIIYDVTTLEPMKELAPTVLGMLLIAILVISAVGAWVGAVTARPIIAPLARLAKLTEQISPTDVPHHFSNSFYHDEVGILARALEQQFLRVQAFIERERSFTRSASHELRTPVTVLKGAAELLQHNPDMQKPAIQRPLQRISRAIGSMENIIETFLLLSRETWQMDDQASCVLGEVLQQCLHQHQHLLDNKPVEIELQLAEQDTVLQAPAALVSIILANLISNAFNYTDQGFVRIAEYEDRICIEDSGIGIAPEMLNSVTKAYIRGGRGEGYGLGLNIVQSICFRLGWQLQINSTDGQGTHACIVFYKAE